MTQGSRMRLLIVGVLAACGAIAPATCTLAQSNIVPDDTLGAESSRVVPLDAGGLPIDVIDRGAIRGSNLFHSFQEFNVAELRGAYFLNPDSAIQNILARVTGGNRSEILGTLGVFNAAGVTSRPNLFLINPNGIIFGPKSFLDVPASFVATTANAVQLGDAGLFNASEPATSNLLTINPSALFFTNPGYQAKIINQAISGFPAAGFFINGPRSLPTARLPGGLVLPFSRGLQVVDGQTLALVGGDISLDEGSLTAVGGRVELGSVAGLGVVSLNPSDKGLALGYENAGTLGNIQLTSAGVITNGPGGGDIQIQAARLFTSENNFFSGISADTQGTRNGGSIFIRATDSIYLNDAAITTAVAPGATGNGGNISIQTPKFTINGGNSSVLTRNFGRGKAGDITIETGQLILTNGAGILTSTLGPGNGGNLTVRASEFVDASGTVTFEGEEIPGGLQADIRGTGTGGTVAIETSKLILRDGAIVSARTDDGPAGDVIVNATESVELLGGGIKTQTFGRGNAGNIKIQTKRLLITESSEVSASARFAQGTSGDIEVVASDSVEAIGVGGIISAAVGAANGGNVTIRTRRLVLRDGGTVSTQALTLGRGGNIDITASDSIEVTGSDRFGLFQSQITTDTANLSNQPSGSLTIHTRELVIQDGGRISVNTLGSNPAGDLVINATESINLIGLSTLDLLGEQQSSGLFATTLDDGLGGSIKLATQQLNIFNGAEINVSSRGTGSAGNLEVDANNIYLDKQGKIIATSASGNGGNITLQVGDLVLLRRGSQISTTAGTTQAGGDGGNINIDAKFIVGVQKENSDITANAFTGSGGRIDITAQGVYGLQFRPRLTPFSDITASSEFGTSGTVTLNTPDVDPSRGLIQLPVSLVDPATQISQACVPRGSQRASSFIITGRGGVPESPTEPLQDQTVVTEWVPVEGNREQGTGDRGDGGVSYSSSLSSSPPSSSSPSHSPLPIPHSPLPSNQIVEATGWIRDTDGTIALVAEVPTVEPRRFWHALPSCP